jgi:lipid A 3-O-deacylase
MDPFHTRRAGPRTRAGGSWLLAALAALWPGLAGAADRAPVPAPWRGALTAVSENDEYAFRVTVDGHYSNGMRLTWLSDPVAPQDDRMGWAHRLAASLPGFATQPGALRIGAAIGHNIYTPADTRRVRPDPKDRPYAGWLYASFGLVNVRDGAPGGTGTLETLELNLGIAGPGALGEQVQNRWHDLIRYPQARGWDSQIRDEPGVLAIYERGWRLPLPAGAAAAPAGSIAAGADLLPHAAAAIGNVGTYAAAGAMLRVGTGLDGDWGPPRIRPALSGVRPARSGSGWRAYAFAGFEARLVAHDMFLDGTMFRDGPRVDSRPFVHDALAGVAIGWGDLRASFVHVWRAREFETQGQASRFGALSLSLRF